MECDSEAFEIFLDSERVNKGFPPQARSSLTFLSLYKEIDAKNNSQ